MNLIKLHCYDNSATNKLLEDFYINSDYIVSFCKDPNSRYTEITTSGDDIYYVKETPGELLDLIYKGNTIKPKTRKESQNKSKSKTNEVADSINGIQDPKTVVNSAKSNLTGDAKIASYKPTLKRVRRGRHGKKISNYIPTPAEYNRKPIENVFVS